MIAPVHEDAPVRGLLEIAFLAGFADGAMHDRERAHLRGLARSLGGRDGLAIVDRLSVANPPALHDAVAALGSPALGRRAFELAVVVCNADGVRSDEEADFLRQLGRAVGLPDAEAQAIDRTASAIAAATARPAPADGSREAAAALDDRIVDASMTSAALDRMPDALASMAILPLQLRLVHRIGRAVRPDLDPAAVRTFAQAVGVGVGGQVLERVGRKLRTDLAADAASPDAGAAAFATTWALGQITKPAFAAGRDPDLARVRAAFPPLVRRGEALVPRYAGPIAERARALHLDRLPALIDAA